MAEVKTNVHDDYSAKYFDGAENDPENLLVVKNLKKYFPVKSSFLRLTVGNVKAVDGVSFKIKRGTTMGLVGESGCGKSTVGRTILRLQDKTDGQVFFNGKEIFSLSKKELRHERPAIQIIFQDPYSSLSPRLPVGEIIAEGVREHGIVPENEIDDYVTRVMHACGLQEYHKDRYPHEFSGGQRQRICIARALALNPDFILCDEPVSALDVSIQAQIINLLRDLQKQFGLTYLFISHDLSVVEHISDTVGVMYLGNLVEYASTERVFANPLHPYTQALFSAIPIPDPDYKMNRTVLEGSIPSPASPPSGCKFHTRCPKAMEMCKYVQPDFAEIEPDHFCACHLYNTPERNAELEPLIAEAKANIEKLAKKKS
ncbi:MAG: ABC transporter ATP-binding protein [Oscillospiraceae bacterium]|nr:ABC transporter ATP-binding protein [Oscillospiraceae bacterium]